MIALLAYFAALALYIVVAIIAALYTYVKAIVVGVKKMSFKTYWNLMWDWSYWSAFAIDTAGSPLLKHLGNDLLIKPEGRRIGKLNVTISHYLGWNTKNNTAYWLGYLLAAVVDLVSLFFGDINHVEKAANSERYKDYDNK